MGNINDLKAEMTLEEYLEWQGNNPQTAAAVPQPRLKKQSPDYVAVLINQVRGRGLPEPRREYHFHAVRRWRFDLDWKPAGR